MPPKTLANLELDYATLSAISPGIILTASTAFGSHEDTGHRVGFDEVGQAMSGAVYISGIPDRPTKAMVPTVGEHTEEVVAEVGYDARGCKPCARPASDSTIRTTSNSHNANWWFASDYLSATGLLH
jgi:crotonobetainyl-CoA:carnitine CoA-transferase CaiB-like acyl-CoA transferase